MTQDEIWEAAEEYQELQRDPINRATSFVNGANFINSRQPYTAEDVESILYFVERRMFRVFGGWIFKHQSINSEPKDFSQLLKLWEESRSERC